MTTRLSSADAAWLHMDRPTNLMVINSVLLFDQPVDWAQVKRVTQERLVDRYPKFRQRVVESHLPLRAPKWEDDPDFALEHHMHHLALPAPGDAAALQELVGDLMTVPLDRNRPLWHEYMVDGFGGGAALIVRMHHCIADGIALARVMLSMTDSAPDAGIRRVPGKPPHAGRRVVLGGLAIPGTRSLRWAARTSLSTARQSASVAISPSHAVNLASAIGRDAFTAVRLLLTPADAASTIKGDPGISRRVAWTKPLPLDDIKRTAHDHEATVNDVLLAAVSGALRRYLRERGGPVHEIQAMVPFNLRPLDEPLPRELGNKFGLVFLPLPVGVSGSYRRLVEVRRRMGEIKHSRAGAVSYELLWLTGLVPEPIERRIVDLFSAKGTAVMTNVPGPKEPVYLAGAPIRTVLVWAPTSGHIGMSVSLFSYRGEVTVGLMTDAALVPEPGEIVNQLETEVAALSKLSPTSSTRATDRLRLPDRQLVDLASAVLVDPNLHTDLRMRLYDEITDLLRTGPEPTHLAVAPVVQKEKSEVQPEHLAELIESALSDPNLHTDMRMRLHREIPELMRAAQEQAAGRRTGPGSARSSGPGAEAPGNGHGS